MTALGEIPCCMRYIRRLNAAQESQKGLLFLASSLFHPKGLISMSSPCFTGCVEGWPVCSVLQPDKHFAARQNPNNQTAKHAVAGNTSITQNQSLLLTRGPRALGNLPIYLSEHGVLVSQFFYLARPCNVPRRSHNMDKACLAAMQLLYFELLS